MIKIVRAEEFRRSTVSSRDVSHAVAEILQDVRARGDEAVKDYEERFDHVRLETLELKEAESVSGEYMMEIKSRTVQFPTGTYCVETRGCWRLFGNYMGGPFVSYAVLSPDNKELVTVTGYVYCPRNKPYTKRDLLMQLESVCYSLKF